MRDAGQDRAGWVESDPEDVMMIDQRLHIIFLRSGPLLLTKKGYDSWRDIQAEFDDYLTSLGPWTGAAILDFLRTEYPVDPPFTDAQVVSFMENPDEVVLVSG